MELCLIEVFGTNLSCETQPIYVWGNLFARKRSKFQPKTVFFCSYSWREDWKSWKRRSPHGWTQIRSSSCLRLVDPWFLRVVVTKLMFSVLVRFHMKTHETQILFYYYGFFFLSMFIDLPNFFKRVFDSQKIQKLDLSSSRLKVSCFFLYFYRKCLSPKSYKNLESGFSNLFSKFSG